MTSRKRLHVNLVHKITKLLHYFASRNTKKVSSCDHRNSDILKESDLILLILLTCLSCIVHSCITSCLLHCSNHAERKQKIKTSLQTWPAKSCAIRVHVRFFTSVKVKAVPTSPPPPWQCMKHIPSRCRSLIRGNLTHPSLLFRWDGGRSSCCSACMKESQDSFVTTGSVLERQSLQKARFLTLYLQRRKPRYDDPLHVFNFRGGM